MVVDSRAGLSEAEAEQAVRDTFKKFPYQSCLSQIEKQLDDLDCDLADEKWICRFHGGNTTSFPNTDDPHVEVSVIC